MAGIESYRLPRIARPRHYELRLEPHLEECRFDGSARVTLELLEPSDRLVLNAAELSIDEARIEQASGLGLEGRAETSGDEQQATIVFPEELPAGDGYVLFLRFRGSLNDQLHGFYRSTFRDESGRERVIATTQFEPSDARRAFPCWDEPDFKASFAVSLVIPEELTALSNEVEVSSEDLGDGRRVVRFAETMPMSTYLVAFVVGPYELTEPRDIGGVALRIAAVHGKSHLAEYAEEVASHALSFLAAYFDVPYPGSKLDHIAVPDFAAGAMENLGCVTYRENALLADPELASQVELQRIASVIAHETAHMWFGDLVTMRWWNGVWLNEAFATFMELTSTEAYRPEWHVWTAFSAGKSTALVTDGLVSTRPVEFEVGRPEEAEAMFDVLTYQKGGGVLRMLEQHLGPDTFRKGMSHYLATHAYGNTETSDLWDALETVSGEPVARIMDTWIQRGGYPLITVAPGDDDATINLSQERFLYTPGGAEPRLWSVPVTVRASVSGSVQVRQVLLDGEQGACTFEGPVDWAVINAGGWGFYRVRYSPELLGRLQSAGILSIADPLERLGLVVDTWAGVVADTVDLSEWVSVASSVAEDPDPDLWAALSTKLGVLYTLGDEADRDALKEFATRLAAPAWSRLGWDPVAGEARRTATARGRVLAVLGLIADDRAVVDEACARFSRFPSEPAALGPDLVAVAARIAVVAGGSGAWEEVLRRYREASVPQDKIRYLYALAEANEPDLRMHTLDLAIGEDVRTQDAPFLIASVLSHSEGAVPGWRWLTDHWSQITQRFPPSLAARIFESLTTFTDPELAAEARRFSEEHDLSLTQTRMDQLLERMDLSVALAARLRSTLATALSG